MPRIVRVLFTTLLRRHPAPDILQACADLQLNDLENALTRYHTRGCETCQNDMRGGLELLELVAAPETQPAELSFLKQRILSAISASSGERQILIADVRRMLGSRAAERLTEGAAPKIVRAELAAFLGNRAADAFLGRMAS